MANARQLKNNIKGNNMDYSSFLLEAKKRLHLLEEALTDRHYKEAYEHAINAQTEIRLLTQIAKELKNGS
jgi:hypothetical protein